MSGHSHFKSIKYKKEISDKKRGQIFSKLSRQITVAAREGGGDLNFNSKLRLAIEMAKNFNLPSDNIEKAIKRGTGELEEVKLESIIFEAYGPGGIALIIEGITDNKNRTLSEIKQVLNQNQGKLVGEGSVKWLFERRGVIIIIPSSQFPPKESLQFPTGQATTKEELELKAIEAGAEDIFWHNAAHQGEPRSPRFAGEAGQGRDILDVYTRIEDWEKVKKNLENQGIKIESASLDWVARESIAVNEKDKEACQKLFEALDENEAVQEIYSNLKV